MIEAQAEKFKRKVMNSDKAMMRYKFSKVHAKWFKEHYQYHLLQDLEKVTCPVLAITGDKDFQADSKKLQRLHHLVKGTLESHVIKDMNHGLKSMKDPCLQLILRKSIKRKPMTHYTQMQYTYYPRGYIHIIRLNDEW